MIVQKTITFLPCRHVNLSKVETVTYIHSDDKLFKSRENKHLQMTLTCEVFSQLRTEHFRRHYC